VEAGTRFGADVQGRVNRQWRLAKRPDGRVVPDDFEWKESPVGVPAAGEVLVRNLWLSFDPTQVLAMANEPATGGLDLGSVMRGLAVGEVVESRHATFRAGDLVHGYTGWEDYTITDGSGFIPMSKVPTGIPPNLAAGTLGVTGMAAYFGVPEVARPRAGETMVVSAAAGGVGSVAAQIGKILGLRVIGIAGGRKKSDWLLQEAGLDAVIDHRSEDVAARWDALCPEGVDIFFDNVGGEVLDLALARLRRNGRVVLCGATSHYLLADRPPGPTNYLSLVMVNGRMEGLLARDYFDRFPEAIRAMRSWLDSGRLKSKEDVVVGLEHAPQAITRLFAGDNFGKQLLKIADASA
jgi:NADPH-dependent curcumin reductase